MPVLHSYTEQSGHYIKARIDKNIVTYQLTEAGYQFLLKHNVKDDGKFHTNLLLQLCRNNDAFTRESNPEAYSDSAQEEFSFDADQSDFKRLPKCEETGSAIDIHLVILDNDDHARLYSIDSRHMRKRDTLASIPINILGKRSLEQICQNYKLPDDNHAVSRLKKWFQLDLIEEWDRIKKDLKTKQGVLGLDLQTDQELDLGV